MSLHIVVHSGMRMVMALFADEIDPSSECFLGGAMALTRITSCCRYILPTWGDPNAIGLSQFDNRCSCGNSSECHDHCA
ncbi:hypothetical protein WJX79_004583 [Trebouxia sp. C0005]